MTTYQTDSWILRNKVVSPSAPAHSTFQEENGKPEQVHDRLWHAALSDTNREKLIALSEALGIDPHNSSIRRGIYEALRQCLAEDAFLCYSSETDTAYFVQTASRFTVAVPKNRTVPLPYPHSCPSVVQAAYRWLGISLLGLLTAGLCTMITAPVAVTLAWRARRLAQATYDQRRATIAMACGATLWGVGLLLSTLFLLHLQ